MATVLSHRLLCSLSGRGDVHLRAGDRLRAPSAAVSGWLRRGQPLRSHPTERVPPTGYAVAMKQKRTTTACVQPSWTARTSETYTSNRVHTPDGRKLSW